MPEYKFWLSPENKLHLWKVTGSRDLHHGQKIMRLDSKYKEEYEEINKVGDVYGHIADSAIYDGWVRGGKHNSNLYFECMTIDDVKRTLDFIPEYVKQDIWECWIDTKQGGFFRFKVDNDKDLKEQIDYNYRRRNMIARIKLSSRDTWKLFLDDERDPKKVYSDGADMIIARTAQEAKDLVTKKGSPIFIGFDHDLGYTIPEEEKNIPPHGPMVETPIGFFREYVKIEETGMDFAKWFCEQDMDGKITIPDNFTFKVHSANPQGAKNIQSYMESYLKHRKNNPK